MLALLLGMGGSGCAIHYFDPATGTEHVWGLGHLKMKAAAPNEGLQAVVHGINSFGLSVGKANKQTYVTLGWQRLEYVEILKEDTSVRLEWPGGGFGSVRVGSEFPLPKRPGDTPAPESGTGPAAAEPR